MNHLLSTLLAKWPHYLINRVDLVSTLPGSNDAQKSIIKRAVHEGYLQRIKRNLYFIKNFPNKPQVDLFSVANFIYGPSYISFESALSYYNWIPERVVTISSATIKRSTNFDNPLGYFSFEKIPNGGFSIGVEHLSNGFNSMLIATPWKAIADMIYTRKKQWKNAESIYLDMRIEIETMEDSNLELLKELISYYPHQKTKKVLHTIYKSLRSK